MSVGLKSFQLSFTESEENDLLFAHYERLEPNLEAFDFPETFLWVKKVDKTETEAVTHVNKLIAEFTTGHYHSSI